MKIIREIKESQPITNYTDFEPYLDEFKDEDREYFIVIGLCTKNKPIYREICHIGTNNTAIIHPREVFRKAISCSVNSIVIAHNHPSGDNEPSEEDKEITKRLIECGELLGIKVLDSIIVSNEGIYSFVEHNEM